jgi:hypothetical protein
MRYDPTDYGAAGDGRTNDTVAFRHLFDVVGTVPATVVLGKVFAVSGLTVPANFKLSFEDGGLALAPGGTAITITGPVSSRLEQIFFGGLPVRFRPGNVPEIYPEWWGAKGDGSRNDRPAIALAVGASSSTRSDGKEMYDGLTGTWIGSISPVVFSGPVYHIDTAISCDAFNIFVSHNRSRIRQNTKSENHFHLGNAFRCAVIGLQFIGGNHAIWYYNNNIDQGRLLVRDCSFQLTSSFAIRVGGSGRPNDTNSTNVTVENCEFYRCSQVAESSADQFLLKNCWVWLDFPTARSNAAVFVNRGFQMIFEQMFGVPDVNDPATGKSGNVRWVDNHSRFYARDCRFGAENGGISTVWHYGAPDSRANGSAVEIYGGFVAAGQATDPAAGVIHLRTHVPQLVVIEGTRGIDQVPVIANSGNLNLDTYFDPYDQPGGVRAFERFRFSIDANLILAPKAIPPQLRGFLTRTDQGIASAAITPPAVGYYEIGQRVRRAPGLGKASDFICTSSGKPGAWNETGKISPWHVGSTACIDVAGGMAAYTLDIPSEARAFIALLSVSARTSQSAAPQRATAAYVISLAAASGAIGSDTLSSTLLHSSGARGGAPSLASLHFGRNATGSPTRPAGTGGQFTAVFDNIARGTAEASIELLHLGK